MTKYIILALSVLIVILGLATMSYRALYKSETALYKTQSDAVTKMNAEANEKLKTLTEARDALQDKYDTLVSTGKKTDDAALNKIDSITVAARSQPVRVRVATCSSGSGSGGAGGQAGAAASDRPGDAPVSTGVLDDAAQQLVAGDRDAVERLQAAFNSCATRLNGAP